MGTVLKPIETNYNGLRFRSRLEARAAVLMDAAGVKYIYEPEGFVFQDGTTYLPDFYLPDQDTFLECKGIMTEKDTHKIEMLAKETGKEIVIVYPDMHFTISYWEDNLHDEIPVAPEIGGLMEWDSWICKCGDCHKSYFGNESLGWECKCCGYYAGDSGFDVLVYGAKEELEYNSDSSPMLKAKRARFEFGERGGK